MRKAIIASAIAAIAIVAAAAALAGTAGAATSGTPRPAFCQAAQRYVITDRDSLEVWAAAHGLVSSQVISQTSLCNYSASGWPRHFGHYLNRGNFSKPMPYGMVLYAISNEPPLPGD